MGMTLWIRTLEGSRVRRDSDDHSWMHRLSDELDQLCADAEVSRLSDFFDFSDLDRNRSGEFVEDFALAGFDEDEEDDLEEPELDEDDGEQDADLLSLAWFDAEQGLDTLGALLAAVKSGSLSDLSDRQLGDLIEELENCIKVLEDSATRGGKFHLAVIE